MKLNSVIALVLSTIIFFSCTTPEEKKFVGVWANKEKTTTIRIKKDGANFMVQTMANGHVEEALLFRLEGSCLQNRTAKTKVESTAENICYEENTGRLEWQGVEWERN